MSLLCLTILLNRGKWAIRTATKDNQLLGKSMRELIKLVSSAKTGHFYTTSKNKRKNPEKLEVKKYDPKVRKHVVYKESKI